MKISTVTSVDEVENPYTKRILANLIDKDPLKVLSKTPRRLKKLTRGLNSKQLSQSPAEGKWSILQIVAHLADVELVLGFRLRMAIAQPGSSLQAMDQDLWAAGLHYDQADLKKKLKLFKVVREEHLGLLKSLSTEEGQHYGMHQERGKETVEHMAQMYAGHDLNHLQQIESIVSSSKKKPKK